MRVALPALIVALAAGAAAAPADDPAARVRALLAREEGVLDALDALDREIVEVARAQEAGRVRLAELEAEQANLERRIADLEGRMAARRALLRRRLRARGRLADTARLRLALGARDLGDLVRWRYALGRVLRHDLTLLRAAREDRAALEHALAERARIATAVTDAQRVLADRRARLEAERATRSALLARIREERALQQRLLAERRRRDEALARRLAAEAPTGGEGLEALAGRLPMPVAGRVIRGFGPYEDPQLGTTVFSKGIEIDAPYGAPVRTIHAGEVVYSGWYKGIGNLVIVRHPGEWYSLYAHLSAISKARGERVVQGDVVGEVGDTGSLRGPMLYFELRRGSEAVDPSAFLRSRR